MSSKSSVIEYWKELAERRLAQVLEGDLEITMLRSELSHVQQLLEHLLLEDLLPAQERAEVRLQLVKIRDLDSDP